jgi:hypothetical protein
MIMILILIWPGTVRAGEGNRTLMTSLEGWGSAIELRPRNGSRRRAVAYRVARQARARQSRLEQGRLRLVLRDVAQLG